MCVIAAKPMGVKMPTNETIKRMWYRNPDGAGIMYTKDGKVRIDKGFMKLDDFMAHLGNLSKSVDLDQAAVVLHFRITTHGGTCPENCHPFPITRSVKALQTLHQSAVIGVAHNGIIPNRPRAGISDTMEFIASVLAPLYAMRPSFLTDANALELIENAIQSKMAFLESSGKITLIGDFSELDGLKYSNLNHEIYSYRSFFMPSGWINTTKPMEPNAATKTVLRKMKKPQKEIPLMFAEFLDPGAYVRYASSGEISGDLADLLLDEHGRAYTYACEDDLCYPEPNVHVFDHNGNPALFEAENASLERVAYTYTDMHSRKTKRTKKGK